MKAAPSRRMGNILILITAALWGFAFVAQKNGMEYLGPWAFSAIRFLIGASCLLLLLALFNRGKGLEGSKRLGKKLDKEGWKMGIAMGVALTFGSILQQIGILYTTASKSGFITTIYILLVPMFLTLGGRRLAKQIWPAALLVLAGLYFLSIEAGEFDFSKINKGDYWVLASASFWAVHIILIEKAVKYHDPLRLSIVQFYLAALLTGIGAFVFEGVVLENIIQGFKHSYIEIAYAGIASIAIAFTLQAFAQRSVPSHQAALIMSLEAVFAVIGGVWLLGEELTLRMSAGFGLMFVGIVLAQWRFKGNRESE